jgi:cell division protein FtsQ
MSVSIRTRAKPHPRIRERRNEVKRREGRRRLRILMALLAAVILLTAAGAVTRSPLLDVDQVVIAGAQHTSVNDVLRAGGLNRHRLMVDVRAAQMSRAIARLAWVDRVRVERHWPGKVRITLRERVPVASVPGAGGGWAIADATGRVLARQATAPPELLQVAGGLPAGPPGSIVARPVIDALAVAAAVPAELRRRAPVIAIADDGLELRLVPSGVAKLGNRDHVAAKLDAVLTVLDHANIAGLAVLDVRVPGAPVLTRA